MTLPKTTLRFLNPPFQPFVLLCDNFIDFFVHFLLFLHGGGYLFLNVFLLHDPDHVFVHCLPILLGQLVRAELFDLLHEFFDFGLEVLADGLLFQLEVIHTVSIEAQQFIHALQVPVGTILAFGFEHVAEELRT